MKRPRVLRRWALLLLALWAAPQTATAQGRPQRPEVAPQDSNAQVDTDDSGALRTPTGRSPTELKTDERPGGLGVGSFRLFSNLSVRGAFDDNAFATDGNEESLFALEVTPNLELQSNWSRNAATLSLTVPARVYASLDGFDTTDVIGAASGRLDLSKTSYLTGVLTLADRSELPSSSPETSDFAEPVEFRSTNASAELVKLLPFGRAALGLEWESYKFSDVRLLSGGIQDEGARDRSTSRATGRVDWEVSPRTSLFGSVAGNWVSYDVGPPLQLDRDSSGYEALVGLNFKASSILSGEVGIGYLVQDYEAPNIDSDGGLALRSNVEWRPDRLVRINLAVARELREAGLPGAASFMATDVALSVAYALRRNFDLDLDLARTLEDYEGIDRQDETWRAFATGNWRVGRTVALFARAGSVVQSTEGSAPGREYVSDRVELGFRVSR